MKKYIYQRLLIRILLPCVFLFIFSCSPVRHLSDDQYLYNRDKIKIENHKIDKKELTKFNRITPNKRRLGFRLHLFIYNLANPEKEKFPSKWLMEIGEPPVIYDSVLVNQNASNYTDYLSRIGFLDAEVTKDIRQRGRKKYNVTYTVTPNEPTIIDNIDYYFEDESIKSYVLNDTSESLIKTGMYFDKPKMESERERIEKNLKNRGFFRFDADYIRMDVKSAGKPNHINVTIYIRQSVTSNINQQTKVRPHIPYVIRNVYITPDLPDIAQQADFDTVNYNRHKVLYLEPGIIKPSILVSSNRVLPSSVYNLEDVENTYVNFSSLQLFKFVNIRFAEYEPVNDVGVLDCNIDLSMRKRQGYGIEFTATHSGGDFGLQTAIRYDHYNFLRNIEHLNISLTGAYESIKKRMELDDPMAEVGVETKLEIPKFLIPFSNPELTRRFSPKTVFQLSYNYQTQPSYIRTIANSSIGYSWQGNSYNRHTIYPVDFSLVKIPLLDTSFFAKNIKGTRLENSYINHSILSARYAFEYTNKVQKKKRNYVDLRSNFETAGLFTNLLKSDSTLFGVNFAQYVKFDIDFRYNHQLNLKNRVVYRVFGGIGLPYGNSSDMPFEKMFWSGGPNSVRAWGDHTLGPGTHLDTTRNQVGDIKLEANIEYRFDIVSIFEGALFIDAGNIWLLDDESPEGGGEFQFSDFYKNIAIGTGVGIRLNFSSFIIRLDMGIKLYDPGITQNSKWTILNPDIKFLQPSQRTLQFGIGYPF